MATRRYLIRRQPAKPGLADLLPWALLVADGVILLKDATFLAGFTLRGHDLASAPNSALNQAAHTVRAMIGTLPAAYSLEVNIHRSATGAYPPAQSDYFPAAALRGVDRERERHFTLPGNYYATECTMLISYTPPREAVRKVEGLFVKGKTTTANYGLLLEGFQQSMDEIQGELAPSFEITRMDSTRLVTECHCCLSGDPQPVRPDGGYLNYALSSGDFISGFVPRFRDQHLYLVSITSFGAAVTVASGDFFNELRDDLRWHMRFLPMSRPEAESKIRSIQKNWFGQRKGARAFLPGGDADDIIEDPHAKAMQVETGEAMGELSSGESRFGYLSNVVIVRDQDLQRGHARAVALVQRAREAGFVALLESTNSPSAFLGSLPGFGAVNLRRLLVSSHVVSHLFPTTMPWPGDRYNPSALFPRHSPPLMMVGGKSATPFNLNLHHGDVGHTLVVGATGSGKSVLVGALMMSWLRYERSRVVCFDVGRSHQLLTANAAGEHVNLGQDDAAPLQPLRHLDTETDRLWAEDWIAALCSLSGISITPDDRIAIGNAIGLISKEKPPARTLTALHVALPRNIANVLEPYTALGTFGRLFDGVQEEDLETARMRTLELSDVLSMGDAIIAPLLLVLFRQVERSLDGAPTLIVIEEAWAALMRSEFSARLQQWLLTLRKQNAAVVIVAHNPLQIKQLPNAGIVTDSCPTRILLPNPEALVSDHAEVYRFLHLTSREIETIARATQKREYYFTCPRGSRLFDLCLGVRAMEVLIPPKVSDPSPHPADILSSSAGLNHSLTSGINHVNP